MESSSTATGVLLFGTAVYLSLYTRLVAKPVCRSGNKTMQKLLDQCPSLSQLFWPPPHCWNAHAELVPFLIRGELNKLYPRFKWYREQVVLPDGELLAVDWVASTPVMETSGLLADEHDSSPVLVLHHGATSYNLDMPGQDYIAPALQRGWKVCVLNRRGHTDVLTRPKWNFFGCVQDVKCVTQSIKDRRPNAKLLTVGISAGSGTVATIFGYGDDVNHFHAGVCICPGYCIEKCMSRFASPYMVTLHAFPRNQREIELNFLRFLLPFCCTK
jgi:predicted alpha/beta-fold hydrolase